MHSTNILLVEDQISVRELFKDYLSSIGYTVIDADCEDAAYPLINDDSPFDLLLLDKDSPSEDSGYRILERARTYSSMEGVPAILMTGDSEGGEETRALKFGFNKFIPKPLKLNDLTSMVQELLNK